MQVRQWARGVGWALAGMLALAGGAQAQEVAPSRTSIAIRGDQPGPTYDKRIFTQFAEHLGNGIYGGLWVGPGSKIPNTRGFRKDVVSALKELAVPVIRWPGGCFADEYHWREGIGPQARRPVKINTHWGGVTEPNTVGTHEFMDVTEQIGAVAYVSGNVGAGSPQETAEWLEYMTATEGSLAAERARNGHKAPFTVPYFGIGNELWGCGGNMRAEYAADETRRYATFAKVPRGTPLTKIASGANGADTNWTEVMMREARKQVNGLSLHYYTVPGGFGSMKSSTDFTEADWAETMSLTLKMEDLLTRHGAIMDRYDPEKKVFLAVDEWGTWYHDDPGTHPGFLRMQDTLRDAVVAGINLNIFAAHADRVKMTAIAQMVNVLQAMIFTDGPRMVRTPTYWVFHMYKPYMDATVLPITVSSPTYTQGKYSMPSVSASAVRGKDGLVHVGLTNLDPNRATQVTVSLAVLNPANVSGEVLTAPAMNALNSFDAPDTVRPVPFTGARIAGNAITVTLPAKSVVMLELR